MTYGQAFLAAAVAGDLITGAFDAWETKIGLSKGAGLEGNAIINAISGSSATRKPHVWAVITYNLVQTALIASLFFTGIPALIGAAFGGLIASSIKHVQQARRWRYLINGGQIDRTKHYAWWQKILGIDWD
jgi:hypothetical protein